MVRKDIVLISPIGLTVGPIDKPTARIYQRHGWRTANSLERRQHSLDTYARRWGLPRMEAKDGK